MDVAGWKFSWREVEREGGWGCWESNELWPEMGGEMSEERVLLRQNV